jgi:hypothetical protein
MNGQPATREAEAIGRSDDDGRARSIDEMQPGQVQGDNRMPPPDHRVEHSDQFGSPEAVQLAPNVHDHRDAEKSYGDGELFPRTCHRQFGPASFGCWPVDATIVGAVVFDSGTTAGRLVAGTLGPRSPEPSLLKVRPYYIKPPVCGTVRGGITTDSSSHYRAKSANSYSTV